METEKRTLLRKAYNIGAANSSDMNTKLGAVIKSGDRTVFGWNTHVPASVANIPGCHERPNKYYYTEHAERLAIFKAFRLGVPLIGATMYCPWAACPDCARAIALTGIKRVVTHRHAYEITPERWKKQLNIGIGILKMYRIKYEEYGGYVGGCSTLFDGERLFP